MVKIVSSIILLALLGESIAAAPRKVKSSAVRAPTKAATTKVAATSTAVKPSATKPTANLNTTKKPTATVKTSAKPSATASACKRPPAKKVNGKVVARADSDSDGCSTPPPIPTLTFDCTGMEDVCVNMCYAVYCKGKSLEHVYDKKGESKRGEAGCISNHETGGCKRDVADGGYRLDATKNSCDEYPFNSSLSGGTGAILRCVPLAHNNKQGNQMTAFFSSKKAELKASGNKYKIAFSNHSKLQHCNAAVANHCVNDGPKAEFKYKAATQVPGVRPGTTKIAHTYEWL